MGFQSDINATLGTLGAINKLKELTKDKGTPKVNKLANKGGVEEKPTPQAIANKDTMGEKGIINPAPALRQIAPNLVLKTVYESQIMTQTQREMFNKRKEMIDKARKEGKK